MAAFTGYLPVVHSLLTLFAAFNFFCGFSKSLHIKLCYTCLYISIELYELFFWRFYSLSLSLSPVFPLLSRSTFSPRHHSPSRCNEYKKIWCALNLALAYVYMHIYRTKHTPFSQHTRPPSPFSYFLCPCPLPPLLARPCSLTFVIS